MVFRARIALIVYSVVCLVAYAVVSLAFAIPAHAQTGLSTSIPGEASSVMMIFSPADPAPGQTVRVIAESPLIDLSNSTLTWLVGGKKVASGRGISSIDVIAGDAGSKTTVEVQVVAPSGARAIVTATVAPNQLDILFDADSYVPPFYRGRALPSVGSSVRVHAVAHFKRASGSRIPDSEITYTWKRNGTNVPGASGPGKSSATLASPMLFGSDSISVAAQTANQYASAKIVVSSVEPMLFLYKNHPLFGIVYFDALKSRSDISDSEMTFTAVPYYAPVSSLRDSALNYVWKVNRNIIETNTVSPNEITINADKSSGIAAIDLSLSHSGNIFLNAQGAWGITFRQSTGGAADPFRPTQ